MGVATGDSPLAQGRPERTFKRVGTFANYRNVGIGETTVSEIVAATANGRLLVYTDSPGNRIGFIDISDPSNPQPAGALDVGGEPTSVEVLGNKYVLVAVNTSASFVAPSGRLKVYDLTTMTEVADHFLPGQPDSIRLSPNGQYAAVIIENERDEDVEVDGVEGGLPQFPAGLLVVVRTQGPPVGWSLSPVTLTGLAAYAPGDPEPEFVDINDKNQAVVSLQENNHLAIVDLASGTVVNHFTAGSVDLDAIDADETTDVITLDDALTGVLREPDGVAWIGRDLFATANEGDLFGGSRGFSIFDTSGNVVFDSGNSLEHLAVRYGHYPESRSANKGTEPEAIEYASFGPDHLLFVASERGSFIAVYDVDVSGQPTFRQLLPAPLGPEGLLAIPHRNLLVASGEEDDGPRGVRSTVMLYELTPGAAPYPQILSADDEHGLPIPWSALSGLTATADEDRLLAVWDSYYDESRIFTIDVSSTPARIVDALTITGGSGDYDPEGITIAPDGSYWIASEGNAGARRNRLLRVDSWTGAVLNEIGLPPEIEACRATSVNRATLGSGFEGVAAIDDGVSLGGYRLYVAQQRGWDYTTPACEGLDDDGGGLNSRGEPNWTRIWIYDPATGAWDHVSWQLASLPAGVLWVGLSEITYVPASNSIVVIERDNQTGDFAAFKALVNVPMGAVADGIGAGDKAVYDMLPDLRETNGWITDKPEGVAVTWTGRTFVVTDNDGVEDWSGETWFLNLGSVWSLFSGAHNDSD
jgi:hypothetical protein